MSPRAAIGMPCEHEDALTRLSPEGVAARAEGIAPNQVELPWPPSSLSPNARIHHFAKAKVTKAYREQAYWLTYGRFRIEHPAGPIVLRLAFHPPDRRRRDLDGMFSSIKAGLDGIADALCVNDQRFEFTLKRSEPIKDGKVIISIGETA